VHAFSKLSATLALTALALTACGKDEPPANNPTGTYGANSAYPPNGQPGGYPGQPGAPNGYPQPGGATTAPAGYPQPGATTAPAGTATAPAGIPGFPMPGATPAAGGNGGSAQVIDPNLAAMAAGPLMLFANGEAPGMAKEGNLAAANFQPGQTLEGNFTIQPGKCYTLVAGGVGVSSIDLEMFLVTPIPGMQGSFAKNASKGAQTSIGGKANCVKLALSPVPVQAKWVATAKAGAGVVAVQLYSK
jgi:hypothetical protein